MKRTAISGLFITAALLASPVFAEDDLCAANLQKIDGNMTKQMQDAAQAVGNTKDCIAITSTILERQEQATNGDSSGS
ncbi:hypothetical protein DCO48_06980 [Pseudomonas sp. SDI]|uniref:hypothetical protein n=1 Tax=Pseudomonas sp. SDI TaxID=2170734 RepID=UPI000DE76D5C|nr:hypothetical protein [Pseudomonas sp. SDI]PWB34446.1 hypothetical protein DCO48_06980 [Pseudomonas sp. SDI]